MPKRNNILLLEDILEAIQDVESFTFGITYDEFAADKKTFNAVIRSFTIIGEAANRISVDVTNTYNEIEWHKVISFRNRLVHEYFGIDYEMVWEVIKNYLSKLEQYIIQILNELDSKK
jgi:uncharacterized protein with HEPN domain